MLGSHLGIIANPLVQPSGGLSQHIKPALLAVLALLLCTIPDTINKNIAAILACSATEESLPILATATHCLILLDNGYSELPL